MAYNSFIALTHFFNAAGNQSLKGAKSSKLPNEVLSMIMQYSDMQTYHSLANVSSCCREMACNRFRLNDYYAVIGINQKPKRLILEDICSGKKIDSTLKPCRHSVLVSRPHFGEQELDLSPIVGIADANRTSFMDLIILCFSGVGPKDPLYKKKGQFPQQ